MNIKTGDKVKILTGKDRGKEGKVLQVLTKKERVVVEGLNMIKRHRKSAGMQEGGIMDMESSIHISNVKKI